MPRQRWAQIMAQKRPTAGAALAWGPLLQCRAGSSKNL